MFKRVSLFTVAVAAAFLSFAQEYSLFGTLDRESPIYKPGEQMVFTVKLLDKDQPVEGMKLKWKRTGDDGKTVEGDVISNKDGVKIKTSTDKPGFVRIYVTAHGPDGKQLEGAANKKGKKVKVFFDGGACVEPGKLTGVAEPKDFDAFWKQQRAALAAVPVKVLEMKEVEGNSKVKCYDMKISCAGGMPVSGYLAMPKEAKAKSLPAEVCFLGYSVRGASKPLGGADNKIRFNINAHGILNGQPQEYYDGLKNGKLKSYCFNADKNASRDTSYFNGMLLRVMRALEYVKTLPEWNGKELAVSGGSQGGYQSLCAAGLDKDVTSCYAWSPWCCDFGRTEKGRIVGGWYVKYSPALDYFDPINLVKRVNPKCDLFIISNLGDYVCPPSGVWIAYNNWAGPKKMEIRQGCEHGFTMKNYPKYTIESKTAVNNN